MAAPGDTSLTLTIHGLESMGDEVYFDVFVAKANALLKGLRELDRALNGSKRFDYTVVDLRKGSTVVSIREKPANVRHVRRSPSAELVEFGRMLSEGKASSSPSHVIAAQLYGKLCTKAQERFDHATLKSPALPEPVRIDRILGKRVSDFVLSDIEDELEGAGPQYFVGTVWGSFEGTIEEMDARKLRSLLPAGHFILSAGGKDVECIFHVPKEEVSRFWTQRVVVEGNAFYDGMSALPARIDIYKVRLVDGSYTDFLERPAVPGFDLEDYE
jgi:hypothetical protein